MITVLGSINVDLVAKSLRLPNRGETVTGHAFSTEPGGKGANQALAARRAGAAVQMVGAAGRDNFADTALSGLVDAGVDLSKVQRVGKATGIASVTVGDDGENTVVVIPGANGLLNSEYAELSVASMTTGDVLMLQLEIPASTVKNALTAARLKGCTTILNIAPFTADAPSLAQVADIVIANETEFRLLIGDDKKPTGEFEAVLRRLHAEWGNSFIVTLGAEGAIAIWKDKIYRSKSLQIKPVDTVGAGDTFCGYVAAGLSDGLAFEIALSRAAIAGSLACLKAGAQEGIPFSSEVSNFECDRPDHFNL